MFLADAAYLTASILSSFIIKFALVGVTPLHYGIRSQYDSLEMKCMLDLFFSYFPPSIQKRQQFIVFLGVGVINTLFGYGIFALLIYLGLHYMLAVLLATCMGVLFNFQTTGRIVFGNKGHGLILRFMGIYLLTYCLNIGIIKALHLLCVNFYVAGAIAVPFVAIISFYLNKRWVFKRV
jgi:putative flippase GtrA